MIYKFIGCKNGGGLGELQPWGAPGGWSPPVFTFAP